MLPAQEQEHAQLPSQNQKQQIVEFQPGIKVRRAPQNIQDYRAERQIVESGEEDLYEEQVGFKLEFWWGEGRSYAEGGEEGNQNGHWAQSIDPERIK